MLYSIVSVADPDPSSSPCKIDNKECAMFKYAKQFVFFIFVNEIFVFREELK